MRTYLLHQDHRETYVMADSMLCRRKERDLIVRWLINSLDDDSETQVSTKHVSVMSIVGHTGVGKTTLARLVYNDWRVRDHFDLVAWVSVSANLDVAEVTRKIIEDFTGCPCQCADLDGMEQILRDKLSSTKAALLVLDDVWEDKARDQMEKLFCVFKASKTRCKILLTTRMQSVTTLVQLVTGCEEQNLRLHELDNNENLHLFWRYAFAGQEVGAQDYLKLRTIGAKIAKKKLGGTPMVTRVASQNLQLHFNLDYWHRFLQDLCNFGATAAGTLNFLKISYDSLSTEQQICFRFCSLFPKNYPFKKEELVQTWIWSGLISSQLHGEKEEDLGELYLARLTAYLLFDRFGGENEEPA
uniref:Uncharacterized protein n=1 Tax=Oryza punctata TaxID=4537 RepID=A0A0E0MKM5_ORYPU